LVCVKDGKSFGATEEIGEYDARRRSRCVQPQSVVRYQNWHHQSRTCHVRGKAGMIDIDYNERCALATAALVGEGRGVVQSC
jgi:hypothetical protein